MLSGSFLIFVVIAVSSAVAQNPDPNVECFKCRDRRNQKDLYAHPTDCHKYYQCFYTGEANEALGIERDCAAGMYWNEHVLNCMPEGSTPCTDRCSNQTVNHRGCYADPSGNCASFYLCSSWNSYHFCCPAGSAFNENDCSCEASETCTDACVREAPAFATTTESIQLFDDHCIDSWGNEIRTDPDVNFFQLMDSQGTSHRVRCAVGSTFQFSACSCAVHVEIAPQDTSRQCNFYFPFDDNVRDHGIHNFFADLVGTASIVNGVSAHGTGSLHLSPGGWLELPWKKTVIERAYSNSACMFLRCSNPPCWYSSGGILSTREHQGSNNYAHIHSMTANNTFRTEVNCQRGSVEYHLFETAIPDGVNFGNDFVQYCYTYGPNGVHHYINNQEVGSFPALGCNMKIPHCPMTVGFDYNYGALDAYIDEFIECPYDLSETGGVTAHWNGQDAMKAAGMIP